MKFAVFCCFLVPMVASITLNCSYSRPGWGSKANQPYSCRLRDFHVESPTEVVDGVTGVHHGNKTQADVRSVKFVNSPNMIYFPKGIEKFFDEITHITVSDAGLAAIHQNDLKPFPKLQYLTFHNTEVTTLESGLFQFNPKLTRLHVTDSPLKSIAADIFNPTTELDYVNFHDSACISKRASNRDEVKIIEQEIVKNCQQ